MQSCKWLPTFGADTVLSLLFFSSPSASLSRFRTVQGYFRNEQQVRMRHPRKHVGLKEKNAKKRYDVAKVWRKRPASY